MASRRLPPLPPAVPLGGAERDGHGAGTLGSEPLDVLPDTQQQEVRRDRELEEKGAARSGSHELEEMGGVSRRWVILLCVSSFCLGLLFTNRMWTLPEASQNDIPNEKVQEARDKMIASLETELLAARSLQESLLNGPLFWKTSKFLNRLGSGNIKWSQESILHLAVAREEIPYVTLGHLPPSGQEVLMASTNCHDLIGDGGYRMADDDEQTAMENRRMFIFLWSSP